MDEENSLEQSMETTTREPVTCECRLSGIISVGNVVNFRHETIEKVRGALLEDIAAA
jgi:hypothetical protein